MKKIVLIISLIMAVIFAMGTTACSQQQSVGGLSIVSITKTSSDGVTDTYTITYSDGSTYIFLVTNGVDGKDGEDGANGKDGKDGLNGQNGQDAEDINILDVYNAWLLLDGNAEKTYDDFLDEYLSLQVSTDGNAKVINSVLRSTAKVYTEFVEGKYPLLKTAVYTGSAVIYKIDEDYTYFITNYHVVYDASAIGEDKISDKTTVYLYGSESYPTSTEANIYDYGNYGISCEYVGGSITSDIAIIRAQTERVKQVNNGVIAVSFAEDYHVGETAIAIGNPGDDGISVTEGVISVDNEHISLSIDGVNLKKYRSIRIDTAIYKGNSGGGLFDTSGRLIGITNAGDGADQNVNYAIPLGIVKSVTENIMYYKSNPRKIVLGVKVESVNSKYVYDQTSGYGKIVEELQINEISENSIANALGLQVGDYVTGLICNGVCYDLKLRYDLGDLLYKVKAGDSIAVKYKNVNGESQTTTYTVQESDLQDIE